MPRLTQIFLGLVALATLGGGAAYQSALSLVSGSGTTLNAFVFLVSAPLFTFAMLVAWRIIYLTAPERR